MHSTGYFIAWFAITCNFKIFWMTLGQFKKVVYSQYHEALWPWIDCQYTRELWDRFNLSELIRPILKAQRWKIRVHGPKDCNLPDFNHTISCSWTRDLSQGNGTDQHALYLTTQFTIDWNNQFGDFRLHTMTSDWLRDQWRHG